MKRIDGMGLTIGLLIGLIVLVMSTVNVIAILTMPVWHKPVVDTDWWQIAVRQHQRAEVYKRIALAYERLDFDCLNGIGVAPAASSNVPASPRRAVKPASNSASVAPGFMRLSDRAKEGMCIRASVDTALARLRLMEDFVRPVSTWSTQHPIRNLLAATIKTSRIDVSAATSIPKSNSTIARFMGDDIIPVRGKGEQACCAHVNVTARLRYGMDDPVIGAEAAPTSPSSLTVNSPTAQSQPMPCRLPIAIGKGGKLLEPCDPTTGRPLSVVSMVTAISAAHVAAVTDGADSTSAVASRRPAVNPPEAPVACPSDALGPVTAYWNAVSNNWYRSSQSNPPGKRLPWLFQCRGDLAAQLTAAAHIAATTDPLYAEDPNEWILEWLFNRGVYMRDVSMWHVLTVQRAEYPYSDQTIVAFNGDVLPGFIDDPNCTTCEVWFYAPMMPGVASVVSWGKR